ncbi:hypothetical protein R9Y00_000063 [Vibrio cholerae]|nr:hypothetical protein [Vibrio cholerae]
MARYNYKQAKELENFGVILKDVTSDSDENQAFEVAGVDFQKISDERIREAWQKMLCLSGVIANLTHAVKDLIKILDNQNESEPLSAKDLVTLESARDLLFIADDQVKISFGESKIKPYVTTTRDEVEDGK